MKLAGPKKRARLEAQKGKGRSQPLRANWILWNRYPHHVHLSHPLLLQMTCAQTHCILCPQNVSTGEQVQNCLVLIHVSPEHAKTQNSSR